MKKTLLLCTIGSLMCSCAPTVYYQAYKVQPINKLDNSLIYEDANCKVFYDFWGVGGDAGFMIYNTSEKNIYLNRKECFFIRNGFAYDYYLNREYTSSNTTSQSSTVAFVENHAGTASNAVSAANYAGFKQTNKIEANHSVGYGYNSSTAKTASSGLNVKEKDVVCIPPNSAKIISEYNINTTLYRNCDLFLYPTKNQNKTVEFSEKHSPLVFSNIISYTLEGTDQPIKMEHKFYVSEISNYSYLDFLENRPEERCKDEASTVATSTIRYFKSPSPYKFFIRYNRQESSRKH